VCSNCGNEFRRWAGQCPSCKEWNSLKEVTGRISGTTSKGGRVQRSSRTENKSEVVNLGRLRQNSGEPREIVDVFSTNIGEFDRVLGKGVVRGAVVLFAGEPGIGKSTLLTQLVGNVGGLYAAGEESAEQIGLRVKRLGLDANKFDVLGTNSIDEIIEVLERTNKLYKLVVVDSIQVMMASEASGATGSPSQIREGTFRLVEAAKRLGVAIFIVGHVTKDGDIAGPKLLEHMVDTVLYFEGEKNGDLRILRCSKNRFGSNDEVGVFVMEEKGLKEMRSDEINLVASNAMAPGKVLTVVMEGSRPMMVEIQALVTESFGQFPKRVFSGVDFNRGQLLMAVAQKVLGIPMYNQDVYVSVSGGLRIEDTGADLAVVGAIWSSFKNQALKSAPNPSFDKEGKNDGQTHRSARTNVLCGEVSLLGEVKKVRGWERRKKEAERLGRKMVEIEKLVDLKKMV